MKKINENTKVTLTLKQLKQLVKESMVKEGTAPASATLKFIEAAISPDDRKGRKSWESIGSFECRFNKRKGLVRIVGCSEEVWQIAKKAGVGLDEIDWSDAANGEDILVKVDPETMQKAQEIFDKWVGYWDEQYGRV